MDAKLIDKLQAYDRAAPNIILYKHHVTVYKVNIHPAYERVVRVYNHLIQSKLSADPSSENKLLKIYKRLMHPCTS